MTRDLSWDGCVNVRYPGGLPTTDGRSTGFGAVVRASPGRNSTVSGRAWLGKRRTGTDTVVPDVEVNPMAFDDKVDNKAEEVGGKVKEGVGKATDDERLEAEGKADQSSANLKQAGEKIKDVFKS
ncbi:uncharacterized protein YjbJ (UPF0337 family) [Actinoplanes couchii]|uniref:CsbD-like domain-containing protein n=2 Tax=Actinoplanes couchii TaxID=403638 RepID=A0ABQ3XKV1_9ACTN|nr:uncharacterized protein YjbJ (UPF0337 family) [Actinoplanes couchii]GID59126.1 hypothetical protein Aco03nite_075300 [Actinoplanes couchii]